MTFEREAMVVRATTPKRRLMRLSVVAISVVVALVAGAHATYGADGAGGKATFEKLCAGCHTIGGGKSAGPDLKGVAERRDRAWVEGFILHPDQVIASGDATAKALVAEFGMQMPNLGLTQSQVDEILPYLGFAAASTPNPSPAPEPTPAPVAGDASRGKSLFKGADDLSAGGPSCLACHSVAGVGALGGGQIGPDLTGAFAKYGGVQGLRAALKSMPFPTMRPIFSRKPLAETEQADLVAFLKTAPSLERPSDAAGKLIGLAIGGVFVLGALILGIWHSRLAGVRKPLVNRSRGNVNS